MLISGFAKKCFISYEPTFGKGFKQGAVNAILAEEKKVQLVGGETVSYDYLIIATGTGGPFPCKLGMNVNEKEGLAYYDEISQLVCINIAFCIIVQKNHLHHFVIGMSLVWLLL